MALISFLDDLTSHANDIDLGRKGLEGRIAYETGITGALTVFQEAQTHRRSPNSYPCRADLFATGITVLP
ncbi:hypothetical protein TREPR_0362 [Treponema primitia ZAS-2]|uniref:Uncharacterized protein n=1 Tax=Treponema primitia (strain ATCC BAA-887 / DSM 12427 / ZAS-2) TaxID=545694 RepID=F5YN22_TREPZ|nr:hypothetical protein [Treponema primitia]AEF86405.1 hypothetical protein TREPR_0362 [Treponema primitia ZAS-2]